MNKKFFIKASSNTFSSENNFTLCEDIIADNSEDAKYKFRLKWGMDCSIDTIVEYAN